MEGDDVGGGQVEEDEDLEGGDVEGGGVDRCRAATGLDEQAASSTPPRHTTAVSASVLLALR